MDICIKFTYYYKQGVQKKKLLRLWDLPILVTYY